MNSLCLASLASTFFDGFFQGKRLFDPGDFLELVVRFAFNLTVTLIIVRGLYYRVARRQEYVFTYMLISSTVFLLCFLLENVKLELGFALGLFAIFGILRYRTDAIPIKEMTYLFVLIGVAVMNALSNKKVSHAELAFANFAIILLLGVLENSLLTRGESRVVLTYEKIELLKPACRDELLSDLCSRTGLDVVRVEVNDLSFLRDCATITLICRTPHHPLYQEPHPDGDRPRQG